MATALAEPRPAPARAPPPQGVVLCLVSAAGFGLMAIFAKEAYAVGLEVPTLLSVRFSIAALAMWLIVAVRRPVAWPAHGHRGLLVGLAMGAIGYTAQAATFFSSLRYIDASLTALLLYVHPALVFLAAVLLGRERARWPKLAALVAASTGAALVLAGSGTGALHPLGVALALAAAVVYTVYILVADSLGDSIDPFLLSALIATGAAVTCVGGSVAMGWLDLDVPATGWALLVAIALLSTVLPITTFLLGLRLVGPSTAAIVSTFEPVVTVVLAVAVLGERLTLVQALGGGLVLLAVVLLQRRSAAAPAPHG